MARNRLQFQKGLSLTEFTATYGTEEQCEAALKAWRWPEGFVCPHCGETKHAVVGARRLYYCHGCQRQTSLKARTVFENTLLPLTKWFQAMWLLTQSKNSISTLEMARQIGVKWDSAALLRHKLMSVMAEQEAERRLDGRVEMDDVVLGGRQRLAEGGKRGRGGPNKTPFVAAVATDDCGRPRHVLLKIVACHDSASIQSLAEAHLAPSARVVTDGLGCFRAVKAAGCAHQSITVSKAGRRPETIPEFRWVNTVIGNLKTAISGTLKAIDARYAYRYLAEFQYRFNRRANLPAMLSRLARAAVRTSPRPRDSLILPYEAG